MRYVVIGAGAVGGTIGGRLAEAGHDVVLVARGEHCRVMREQGLRLLTPEGPLTLRVPVTEDAEEVELSPADVLMLATKTQDTPGVLATWAQRPVAGGGSAAEMLPIMCAQNGVENERLALRRFRRVYGVCVWLPASHLEPGVVVSQGSPCSGLLNLGRYPCGVDELVRAVAADLEGARFRAPAEPDVMRWKHGKLLMNLGNALEAVGGREAVAGPLMDEVLAEGNAVLAAAGIDAAQPGEQDAVRGQLVNIVPVQGHERSGGSSWQSLRRGTGSIEADFLNGEIVLLGRLHGVPTPVNETLQRLADEFAARRREPGSMPAAELIRVVDAARRGVPGAGTAGEPDRAGVP